MKKLLIVVVGGALAVGLLTYLAESLLSPAPAPPPDLEPPHVAVQPPAPAAPTTRGPPPPQPAAPPPVPTTPTQPAPVAPAPPAPTTPVPAPTQPVARVAPTPPAVPTAPDPVTPAPAPTQPVAPTTPAPAPTQPAAPATPAPAQPDAPKPPATEPQPPKQPPAETQPPTPAEQPEGEIILSALPDASNVAGGKVVYEREAFPIVADKKPFEVQGQLGLARPLPCRTCRGTGKVTKKRSSSVSFARLGRKPLVNTWEETCPVCRCEAQGCPPSCSLLAKGTHLSCERCCGRGTSCATLQYVGHCCPKCHARYISYWYWRTRPCQGNCCGYYHNNQPTCPDCKICADLRSLRQAHSFAGVCDHCRTALSCNQLRPGHGTLFKPERVPVYLDLVAALAHLERGDLFAKIHEAAVERMKHLSEGHVAPHLGPVWNEARAQRPRGQPVIVIGLAGRVPGPPGALSYSRLTGQGRPLAMVVSAGVYSVPDTRVVVGGLMVGRWTSDDGTTYLPVILTIVTAVAPAGP
ncbi:MAG TPA: hypothetical protein VM238_18880 [Phycisphaerae bacterium]|nr:hypothetical protein [Phycisphaerae bacterium]